MTDDGVRLDARIDGWVQGVGFRWWTRDQAGRLGLSGTATNLRDGSVRIVAEGSQRACATLLDLVRSGHAPGVVRSVDVEWGQAAGGFSGFSVS
jgi:acylphosphatase